MRRASTPTSASPAGASSPSATCRSVRPRRNIDARGRIVAPGFIDSHTHDDQALLAQPDMSFKVSQGVTTVIAGNCGISLAPLREGRPLPPPLNLLDVRRAAAASAPSPPIFDALRRRRLRSTWPPLVGHTTLRVARWTTSTAPANADEIAAMRALLAEALDAGAIGLSTGTFYPPAAAAPTEEIIGVGRAAQRPRRRLRDAHARREPTA